MTLEAVLKRAISLFLRVTNPGSVCPPALTHLGSSCSATVLGLSPAFNLLIKVDDPVLVHPTLNAQDTRAPYWLSVKLTLSEMSRAIQFWKVGRSFLNRDVAVVVVRGNGKGTSEHPVVWQR